MKTGQEAAAKLRLTPRHCPSSPHPPSFIVKNINMCYNKAYMVHMVRLRLIHIIPTLGRLVGLWRPAVIDQSHRNVARKCTYTQYSPQLNANIQKVRLAPEG